MKSHNKMFILIIVIPVSIILILIIATLSGWDPEPPRNITVCDGHLTTFEYGYDIMTDSYRYRPVTRSVESHTEKNSNWDAWKKRQREERD